MGQLGLKCRDVESCIPFPFLRKQCNVGIEETGDSGGALCSPAVKELPGIVGVFPQGTALVVLSQQCLKSLL